VYTNCFFLFILFLVCNFYTTECKGLRWNKLIIISQVPMDLRKTKPTEAQSGQNRDEQNKQFVGDLLFGHNPPDQNDSGGIQQSQRARIHHGYQLIGHLGTPKIEKVENVVNCVTIIDCSYRKTQFYLFIFL